MKDLFEGEGLDVQVVGINVASALEQQGLFTEVCTFPFFQDVEEVSAVTALGGTKDDFYVYGADGLLRAWLPPRGEVSTDLSTPEGWAALEAAIRAAL